jgi:zinc transport system substrate-binding protein
MKHLKKILFAFLAFILILLLFVMNQEKGPQSSKVKVVVSSFALYDILKHIAGESVEIINILPFGVDVHSFEPTPKLVASLEESNLIFYSGAGLEPWTKGFHFAAKTIDMSEHVNLRELGLDELEHHEHHHDEDSAHSKTDPHYWLDFNNMINAAQTVTDELTLLLPKNAAMYEKNKEVYIQMLKNLDTEYASVLRNCANDTIFVNHNAFSYLSKRYGFKVEALSGVSPEAEPSPKNMAKLIEHIKEDKIQTIFFENFASDRAIKSISRDTNVSVDVLQPLGNITADEAAQNLSYEEIMRKNLEKISKALMCR